MHMIEGRRMTAQAAIQFYSERKKAIEDALTALDHELRHPRSSAKRRALLSAEIAEYKKSLERTETAIAHWIVVARAERGRKKELDAQMKDARTRAEQATIEVEQLSKSQAELG